MEKGVVVYVKLLEVLKTLQEDLDREGIEYKTITGAVNAKNRAKINEWFCSNPENRVIFISLAGGQSLNLHATNEIILYNIPNGYGPFKQIIGRIARGFGKYTKYNIHTIVVEDSIDAYYQILLSSRKELENELLTADSILLKEVQSFDLKVLKKVRERLLW
jgi:SNF2 family DNA or RNA helicase